MRIIRPGDDINRAVARNSVFLAGPTPRDETGWDWRPQAIEYFKHIDKTFRKNMFPTPFRGVRTLFVPSPFVDSHDEHKYNYEEQIDWENRALEAATVILFWVPRELESMPAFTTNVEFGMYVRSGKMIYGRPPDAPKTGYLDWHAKQNNVPTFSLLEETIVAAVEEVGMSKGVLQG